jgi:hypothetical protein
LYQLPSIDIDLPTEFESFSIPSQRPTISIKYCLDLPSCYKMLSQQLQLDHIFGFTDPQYNHLSTLSPHIRQIINHEKYIQSYYLSTNGRKCGLCC